MMKLTVVIPTYVCRHCGSLEEDEQYYDHPTPLEAKGTLGRTLASMKCLDLSGLDVRTVVLGCPTTREIAKECDEKLVGIIERDGVLPTDYLGVGGMDRINEAIGKSAEGSLFSLFGYAAVRNACLLAGVLTGADGVVLIDDDEIFEREDFLQRVRSGLSSQMEGQDVSLLAGYYYMPDGTYLLSRESEHWTVRWRKSPKMNALWRKLVDGGEGLQKTPFALGGNLSVRREVFEAIPFDPQATRGEDGDYIMNCMLQGVDCWFDGKLGILHDPPPKPHRRHVTLAQDFQRFLYGRAKLAQSGKLDDVRTLSASDFDPYPGPFLTDDLPSRIVQTATLLALDHLAGDNEELYQLTMNSMQRAFAAVEDIESPLGEYLAKVKQWRSDVDALKALVEKDWAAGGSPLQAIG